MVYVGQSYLFLFGSGEVGPNRQVSPNSSLAV